MMTMSHSIRRCATASSSRLSLTSSNRRPGGGRHWTILDSRTPSSIHFAYRPGTRLCLPVSHRQFCFAADSWCVSDCRVHGSRGKKRLYAGCVSPIDARYASPLARKSTETGHISWKPVAATLGDSGDRCRQRQHVEGSAVLVMASPINAWRAWIVQVTESVACRSSRRALWWSVQARPSGRAGFAWCCAAMAWRIGYGQRVPTDQLPAQCVDQAPCQRRLQFRGFRPGWINRFGRSSVKDPWSVCCLSILPCLPADSDPFPCCSEAFGPTGVCAANTRHVLGRRYAGVGGIRTSLGCVARHVPATTSIARPTDDRSSGHSVSHRDRRNAARRTILVTDRVDETLQWALGQWPSVESLCSQAQPPMPIKSAVQRWQEGKPLHETGRVCPAVPCSSRPALGHRGGQQHWPG